MQLLAVMTCCTRPKRVAQSLMIGCVLIWFSHATCLAPKSNGLYYRTFTYILSHSINGWANSMYTSSTTFCGAQARRQLHVGPFHRSLVFWAAWFAHVSASSMHQFCRWDTRHQVFIFQSVTAFHLLIQEFCLLHILPPMQRYFQAHCIVKLHWMYWIMDSLIL